LSRRNDRQQWYSVLGELGVGNRPWPYPDRNATPQGYSPPAYRSQTARLNRLIEDIRNDVMRIDPFFSSARYVTEMDRKREKALAYVSNLTPRSATTRCKAHRRKPQHRALGFRSLHERTESYRVALERMVIAAAVAGGGRSRAVAHAAATAHHGYGA